jgi:tetratricopeptide (TPR) repeat protein
MRPSVLLSLFFFSTAASALTGIDRYLGSIGSASMDAERVDVTLFGLADGSRLPAVKVIINGDEYLFALRSSTNSIYVSKPVAKRLKLQIKEGNEKLLNLHGKSNKYFIGGERSFATLDEMKIGGLTLSDMTVAVTVPSKSMGPTQGGSASQLAGFIGLGALPADISWSVSPSTGMVSFAQGAETFAAGESAVTVPYVEVESDEVKYGKTKKQFLYRTLLVDADIGGVPMQSVLEIGNRKSTHLSVAAAHEMEDAAEKQELQFDHQRRSKDLYSHYVDTSIGGQSLGQSWFVQTTRPSDLALPNEAMVGPAVLGDYDIAVNRSEGTVTLEKATAQTREDPMPFLIAQTKAWIEAVSEGDSSCQDICSIEDKDASLTIGQHVVCSPLAGAESGASATDKPSSNSADWIALSNLYVQTGDLEQALAAVEKASSLDEQGCETWLHRGEVEIKAGRIADAIVSFEKSADMYHAWYANDVETRTELKKEIDGMSAEEKESSEHVVATSRCHLADGRLAAATYAAGDLQTVQGLYQKRFDLMNGRLALIAGNAMITMGSFDAAQGPLRQAMKSSLSDKHNARFSLGLVYVSNGDWNSASALFERGLQTDSGPVSVQLWLEGMQELNGRQATLEAAQGFVKSHPQSAGAMYGLAWVASSVEDEESKIAAKALGDAYFSQQTARYPRVGGLWAAYARYLVVWGEHDAAKAAAEKALMLTPTAAGAWLAMADVYQAQGDLQRSRSMKIRAAQSDPWHPGYARLFNTIGN